MTGEENLEDSGRPVTDSERKLAALWADVLGVPVERIRRTDNFFEIGGTSRAAARLVIALERRLTIGEFARTPSLTHLADLLDQRLTVSGAAAVGVSGGAAVRVSGVAAVGG
ncbi:acyl carrier protein [Streptomyces montanus]|uniref:Acyl carrier protein n=1 Tax=Streptomyces montanus TaxID=2580423 RepID=A0A5R9FNW6_9ACTN|nr:phosphopantetheine-binding protein [Streptomyces montanus]TLS41235.1 acyl carrier protein [Streptomyces montanus]